MPSLFCALVSPSFAIVTVMIPGVDEEEMDEE